MASHNPYRFVVYALMCIMIASIIVDCILNRILWPTIFFYALTQFLMIFRLLGRNGASIVIHVVSSLAILLVIYLHYNDQLGLLDYEYYRETLKSLSYKLIKGPKVQPKQLSHRASYMSYWLTYPLFILAFVSISGICCILNLSLSVRRLLAGIHSTVGLSIAMIYFLICVFYAHYFKTYNVTVTIKMLYYLLFLFVMLSPKLISYSQIFSEHFTDVDEEEELDGVGVDMEVLKDEAKEKAKDTDSEAKKSTPSSKDKDKEVVAKKTTAESPVL